MLVVLLCTLHFAHCIHQPDVASFGDFMEYVLSVPAACANATNGKNLTNLISVSFVHVQNDKKILKNFIKNSYLNFHVQKDFAACTNEITATGREAFDNLVLICENQEKYLKCWNQLKDDIVKKCQQNVHLPGVYAATVKSVCGNDKGNTTISKKIHKFCSNIL